LSRLALTLAAGGSIFCASPQSRAQSGSANDSPPPAKVGQLANAAKTSRGDEARGRAIAERVQRYYGKRKDFQATFTQRYTYAALGRVEEKTGVVQVKKPGLLRWEYAGKDKKLLVLDGKAFWQWSPEDNQVTVKRDVRGEQLSSAFTFLWGKGDLLAEFSPKAVALPEGLPPGDAVELDPKKPGGNVQRIVFSVDAEGRVLASVVTDGSGNENRLVFEGAKIDQNLPDSTFQFAPPAGANVQELP
jgi:outer membrane lipoprotein carrier protein